MEILFDVGVPKALRSHLSPHRVTRVQTLGWGEYKNGDLLSRAEMRFDALITTDSNLEYQQNIHGYDIVVIVLRAFSISLARYVPLVPEMLNLLETTAPGEIVYVYESDILRVSDARKGR